jgi:hypothetical protein
MEMAVIRQAADGSWRAWRAVGSALFPVSGHGAAGRVALASFESQAAAREAVAGAEVVVIDELAAAEATSQIWARLCSA